MTHWVKVIVAKPQGLGYSPGSTQWKEKTSSYRCLHSLAFTPPYTHIVNKKGNKNFKKRLLQ